MDIHRVQPRAEQPLGHTAVVQTADGQDGLRIELLDGHALRQVGTTRHVFRHHQPDVILVALVVVEGETDQFAQGFFRRQVVE